MAKYYGAIGFETFEETTPDVWESKIIEKNYSGDVIRSSYRNQSEQRVNDSLSLNNRISIVANSFAISNYGRIRYAVLNGIKWKVSGVEIQHPRLILELSGIWNLEGENGQ